MTGVVHAGADDHQKSRFGRAPDRALATHLSEYRFLQGAPTKGVEDTGCEAVERFVPGGREVPGAEAGRTDP